MVINDNNNNRPTTPKEYRIVLSIAGSDSSGGAGIQADIKTFSALGVYGATAITAITAQNTQGVHAQLALPPQMVHDQIVAVVEDLHTAAIKIGMLANAEVANSVADALEQCDIPIILDPVIVSTSGHRLLSVEAEEVVKQRLLPLATLITPNIPEMETLANMPIRTGEDKTLAAEHLFGYGVKAILLKGGHEVGDTKSDILFTHSAEGVKYMTFTAETIPTLNTHGTGCTLSSAIAAYIARGCEVEDAIRHAKEFVTEAIRHGADIATGHGYGPVNHGFNPQKLYIYDIE